MAKPVQIYLFGDQTFDFYPKLKELLHSNKQPILESFVERSYYQIRAEIGFLSQQERATYPRFTCVADILSWERKPILQQPAVQSALTCVYQLGEFIRSAQSNNIVV